jgi:hypothetical protein
MDVKYARGPIKFSDWTNIFMRDSAPCPLITNYTEYANYPELGSCFILKTSMYTYQPLDLENFDRFSWAKNKWIDSEVRGAYLEAFDLAF